MPGDALHGLPAHISDEDILQLCDGELPPKRSAEVRAHLEACWSCRARVKQIEGTIANFVDAYHEESGGQIPSAEGPRAMLKAQLSENALRSSRLSIRSFFARPIFAYGSLAILVAVVGWSVIALRSSHEQSLLAKAPIIPNRQLTPGAIRLVSRTELCSVGYRDMNRKVPREVQLEVFRKYGIAGARVQDFEVDYLITPELGGSDDINNLWPEPYASDDWGAYVKDALEDKLHTMVCDGSLDLATAQKEMSGDWISAYKKYFNTDKPLPLDSASSPKDDAPVGPIASRIRFMSRRNLRASA